SPRATMRRTGPGSRGDGAESSGEGTEGEGAVNDQGGSGPGPVAAPSRVAVRMHCVGFGDCFLLSFTYPEPLEDNRAERHVLIDFGSVSLPAGWKDLGQVAGAINARTGGQIDAVVVTH